MKERLNIGLLGMGVVGTGVCQLLAEQRAAIASRTGVEIFITKALASPYDDKSAIAQKYGFELTSDLQDIYQDPSIDVVVELIGKINPAKDFILGALAHKKHVVTANKDLLATHGPELTAAAKKAGVSLFYEASVGGGIPILRTLSTHYLPDTITSISGIVNGTTNYMLTKMLSNHLSYEDALAQAQAKGFAESDPTNDVDGIDAAYKMILLTKFAFGMTITMEDITVRGIRDLSVTDINFARQMGYEVKLIGTAEKIPSGQVTVSVGPVLVPVAHPLASIKDEFNGVYIESTGIDRSMVYGPGAGSRPTATSVLADLTVIAKNKRLGVVEDFVTFDQPTNVASADQVYGSYYISLNQPLTEIQRKSAWIKQDTILDEKVFLTQALNHTELTDALSIFSKDQINQIMKVKE
jgi:homoserine dehydrogenase